MANNLSFYRLRVNRGSNRATQANYH